MIIRTTDCLVLGQLKASMYLVKAKDLRPVITILLTICDGGIRIAVEIM